MCVFPGTPWSAVLGLRRFGSLGRLGIFSQIELVLKGLRLFLAVIVEMVVVPVLVALFVLDDVPLLNLVLIVVFFGLDDKSVSVFAVEYLQSLDAESMHSYLQKTSWRQLSSSQILFQQSSSCQSQRSCCSCSRHLPVKAFEARFAIFSFLQRLRCLTSPSVIWLLVRSMRQRFCRAGKFQRLVSEHSFSTSTQRLYNYSMSFFSQGLNLPIFRLLSSRLRISAFLRLVSSIIFRTSGTTAPPFLLIFGRFAARGITLALYRKVTTVGYYLKNCFCRNKGKTVGFIDWLAGLIMEAV